MTAAAKKPSAYRIRWAICTNSRDVQSRMCIAERKVLILGIIPFWWPVGDWHRSEHEARADAEYDIDLRQPLPETVIL